MQKNIENKLENQTKSLILIADRKWTEVDGLKAVKSCDLFLK